MRGFENGLIGEDISFINNYRLFYIYVNLLSFDNIRISLYIYIYFENEGKATDLNMVIGFFF